MFNQYIQYPYIIFPFGLAKPALVITIAYICVLTAFLLHGVMKGKLKLTLRLMSEMRQGEQNKITISIVGFIIMLASSMILPLLLDESNIILSASNVYLQYEPLLFVGLFLFLGTAALNKSNPDKQIKVSNKGLSAFLWISLFAGIVTGQIDYTFWQNIVVIICAGIIIVLFLFIDIKALGTNASKRDQFDMIPYTPVQSAKELFPQHKIQAEDIANIIINSSFEPFSVCVSGEWGTGKTSVVNGVMEILGNEGKNIYEFIHINALELDNKQAMINYLFSRINEILKTRGVYVGVDSEFKDFISSSAGALTSNSIGTLLHKKFFYENADYRSQKAKLEKVLQRALGKGKLIVVVDDIERCDKSIAREYLFLIKEVATMRNCVSIFVTDYNMLNKLVCAENIIKQEEDMSDFLSKFFNYRIELRNELPENVFEFYDKYFNNDDSAFLKIYKHVGMSPGTWYSNVISGINSKLDEETENKNKYYLNEEREKDFDNRINRLETLLSLFESLTNNSRNVVKFYNVFKNNVVNCDKLLRSSSDEDKLKYYIDSRNIGQVLYVLSFAEIFLPNEYQNLIKRGAKYAETPLYGSNESVSEKRKLLIELMQGMVYGEYFDFQKPNGFIKQDIRYFIETFLGNKSDLAQLVNPFSSQEEKWLKAIDDLDVQQIKANWTEMVLMVLQKNPDTNTQITNEWRIQTFTKLLDFAQRQVELGEWTSDKIFSLFDSDMHTDRWFSVGTGMLTTFWEHLRNSTIYKRPSEKLVEEMKIFPCHYTYDRMGIIYRLAHYLIPNDGSTGNTNNLQEYMLNSNKKYTDNISLFLDKVALCIPDHTYAKKEWNEKYTELAEKITAYLNKNNLSEYPDVMREIEIMNYSLEELLSLEKILNWVEAGESKRTISLSDFSNDRIEQTIQYFEKILKSPDEYKKRDIDQQFSDFFRWLQRTQDLAINEQQIKRLHELVTIYVELSGYSSMPYRRLLINIADNQADVVVNTDQ